MLFVLKVNIEAGIWEEGSKMLGLERLAGHRKGVGKMLDHKFDADDFTYCLIIAVVASGPEDSESDGPGCFRFWSIFKFQEMPVGTDAEGSGSEYIPKSTQMFRRWNDMHSPNSGTRCSKESRRCSQTIPCMSCYMAHGWSMI